MLRRWGLLFLCSCITIVINAQHYYKHERKASAQAKMLNAVYKMAGVKKTKKVKLGAGNSMTRPQPIRKLRRKTQLEVDSLAGRAIYYLTPKQEKSSKYILYLHGGGYTETFVKQHWLFMLELSKRTSYTIVAADYPLAPKSQYQETIAQMLMLYQELGEAHGYENIYLMGDSAGGGLALALALAAKDANLPQLAKLILLSPWLDLKMDNSKIQELDRKDPMINLDWANASALAYAGTEENRSLAYVSPTFGNLDDLAPIALFIGGRDVLLADCEVFREKMLERDNVLNYYFYPKMTHVWTIVSFLPEAETSVDQIIKELGIEEKD